MPDENKEVETNVQPASTGEQGVETTTQTTATEPAPVQETKEIDYKAEYEAAQKQLEQAEHVIVETKKENKQLKATTTDPDGAQLDYVTADELKDTLKTEMREEFEAKLAGLQKTVSEVAVSTVDSELDKVSKNPDEQALIRLYYDKKIVKSGLTREAIAQDLQLAKVLANKKSIEKENSELKAALIAKSTVGTASVGTNQDTATQTVVTEEDQRIANRFFGGDVQRYLKTKNNH